MKKKKIYTPINTHKFISKSTEMQYHILNIDLPLYFHSIFVHLSIFEKGMRNSSGSLTATSIVDTPPSFGYFLSRLITFTGSIFSIHVFDTTCKINWLCEVYVSSFYLTVGISAKILCLK